MINLTDIKYRIKSIAETRKITSAMETISIAKMRKALVRYEKNTQYFNSIRAVMKDIILHTKDISNRYLQKKGGSRAVFVVIASDKGLAGGYNHNVLNKAWDAISKWEDRHIFTVGQVAREFFERRKEFIDIEFTHITNDPSFHDVSNIVESIIGLYADDMMDNVYVVYTKMINSATMAPEIIQLLPLEQEKIIEGIEDEAYKDEDYFNEIEYDPSPDAVLDVLVPQYLAGIIYGALVQSIASEHSSRMRAMSSATKNATEILDRLNLAYNRARQESVTNELTEIITSASGLK